jgi:large subunit ribosomal protein L10
MALTKEQKTAVVADLTKLLSESKLTVVAQYKGMTVKSIQTLRKEAKEDGTSVKVVKNRLVKKAISEVESLKDVDTSALHSQLLYAFNDADEVAPAKALNAFSKKDPSLQFVGAFTAEGTFISADEVKALANLPSKNQLIAGIINTLNSPVRGVMGSLSGDIHGLLKGLEAKATN